jgi:uncharacterized protein with FMN-binding domain
LFLSTFVVFSFFAYVVHERFVSLSSTSSAALPQVAPTLSQPSVTIRPTKPIVVDGDTDSDSGPAPSVFQPQPTIAPAQVVPTDIPPTAIPATQGQYKDGQYTGPEVDAYYGLVQVQATVQNGQIASVDFLEYPTDRRTSQRINAVAVPYLKTEALQAQSANVNIISGATLTSEAFMESLNTALASAKP